MKIAPRTGDILVGLLVLAAGAVLITVFIVTSRWNEQRVTIYMLSPSVQDLKLDAPVKLQGMQIGEVATISPKVDSSLMGPPQFVVALRLREHYSDGTPIVLPRSTTAELGQGGVLTSIVEVSLLVPSNARFGQLQPGDTIPAAIRQSATEALKEVADSLKTQVSDILRDTRKLLSTLDHTARTAETQLQQTAPEVRQTLADVRAVLTDLQPAITKATTFLGNSDERMGTLGDSLSTTLSDARRSMAHLDSMTLAMTSLASDNRQNVAQTVTNLRVVSRKLEFFLDQLARRPLRMFTGTRVLSRDSILATPDTAATPK
jgi:ABC-type transporter Mla subunit MlaD